jgi:predicted ATP-dependent serine protease
MTKIAEGKEVWICTECGWEGEQIPAFCPICNNGEDLAFRLKERHDYKDEKDGRPLVGVRSLSKKQYKDWQAKALNPNRKKSKAVEVSFTDAEILSERLPDEK